MKKAITMNLFDEIQQCIFKLESIGCKTENIKITTSFIVKKLFDDEMRKLQIIPFKLNKQKNQIFGIEISFNHFSNNIVIYDKKKACLDEEFKIILSLT